MDFFAELSEQWWKSRHGEIALRHGNSAADALARVAHAIYEDLLIYEVAPRNPLAPMPGVRDFILTELLTDFRLSMPPPSVINTTATSGDPEHLRRSVAPRGRGGLRRECPSAAFA